MSEDLWDVKLLTPARVQEALSPSKYVIFEDGEWRDLPEHAQPRGGVSQERFAENLGKWKFVTTSENGVHPRRMQAQSSNCEESPDSKSAMDRRPGAVGTNWKIAYGSSTSNWHGGGKTTGREGREGKGLSGTTFTNSADLDQRGRASISDFFCAVLVERPYSGRLSVFILPNVSTSIPEVERTTSTRPLKRFRCRYSSPPDDFRHLESTSGFRKCG